MLLFKIKPQFRSIIPCEVLLYIGVTFLDLSIDMGIFWDSWFKGFDACGAPANHFLKDFALAGLRQITF